MSHHIPIITGVAIAAPAVYLLIVLRLQVWLEINRLWEGGDAWAFAIFWPLMVPIRFISHGLYDWVLCPVGHAVAWTYDKFRTAEKRKASDATIPRATAVKGAQK